MEKIQITVADKGQNNKIVVDELARIDGLKISITGNNNKIVISKSAWIRNTIINLESSENNIFIGEGVIFTGRILMKIVDKNTVSIGDFSTVGDGYFLCCEGRRISIGSDCMIAYGIEFRTSDSHEVFDIDDGHRINDADDITIGNHVWIGAYATLLKGSVVLDNSIVSMKSLVTKAFEKQNIIIAGIPAKVIKTRINWKRPLLG